jgi:ABC transporter, ATP-binding protein
MKQPIIDVKHLSKSFEDNIALDNINFQVKKGDIFGFLGPSGAGKTTTINLLTGQLKPSAGDLYILDKLVSEFSRNDLANIGIVSDQSGYYKELSLYDNLVLFAKIHNTSLDYLEELLSYVQLSEDKDKLAKDLSTGMKQRMLLVRALLNKPKLLFLDEPTSGLDPTTSQKIHHLLLELKNQGTTIFLTTHDMNEAHKLCDQLVLLHKGSIIESGSPQGIIQAHYNQKQVEIRYKGERLIIQLAELEQYLNHLSDIESIHTCEPTLEEVFIKLTGDELTDD